ncbi:MAG: Ig-like domain repeat protein [Methanosphaera sp.]|nr:Ig-like domain repeat protein [Methanosphaera sp.]
MIFKKTMYCFLVFIIIFLSITTVSASNSNDTVLNSTNEINSTYSTTDNNITSNTTNNSNTEIDEQNTTDNITNSSITNTSESIDTLNSSSTKNIVSSTTNVTYDTGNETAITKNVTCTSEGLPDIEALGDDYQWADENGTYTITSEEILRVMQLDSYCQQIYGYVPKYTFFRAEGSNTKYVISREKWNVIARALNAYHVNQGFTSVNPPYAITVNLSGQISYYPVYYDAQEYINGHQYTCGPTAMSMISQALNCYSSERKLSSVYKTTASAGTIESNIYTYSPSVNMKVTNITNSKSSVISALQSGAMVFWHISGHYMCIIGYNSNTDKFLCLNPSGPSHNIDAVQWATWTEVLSTDKSLSSSGFMKVTPYYNLTNQIKTQVKYYYYNMGGKYITPNNNEDPSRELTGVTYKYYKNATITASNINIDVNQTTIINASIIASDNTVPTGNVTITINGKNYTTTVNSDGSIKLSYKFTSYGTYSVIIKYNGNSTCTSTSKTITVVVEVPQTSTVSSYTELYNRIEAIKSQNKTRNYTINLVDGNYKITNTINWGNTTHKTTNITINGNNVSIYGSEQKQFMRIYSGYSVTLNNINIINAYASNGGAIYNGGNLTISYSLIENAKAINGSAIYNYGYINITNSNFTSNNATRGGVIYTSSTGKTYITSSKFTQNTATEGAVIYNNGITVINNSNLTSNMGTYGGVIYNKGKLNISSSNLTSNKAQSGGVIYNYNHGNITATRNNYTKNYAYYGGVVYNYKNSYITIRNSIFNNNTATNAEIVRNNNATATLTNNTITYITQSNINVNSNNGVLTTSNNTYNRLYKLTATLNMATEMFLVSSSGTLTGNITDSDGKLVTDTLTVTISINQNKIKTITTTNGKINTTINLSNHSSGVYNITTTLDESSNYTSSTDKTLLIKNMTNTIIVSSVSAYNGDTRILTAYITDSNGYRATNGSATFKLNHNSLKSNGTSIKVNITNGIAQYTYTIPDYSAKNYTLTAVANVNNIRIENSTTLTILKSNPVLSTGTEMFVIGSSANLVGEILNSNGSTVTRDTKVAVKINGKTIATSRVINGQMNISLDLSNYTSGVYTINIILGENGCYNTAYYNITLIKDMKNTLIVMPVNSAVVGQTSLLTAYITDSSGHRQTNGTVTYKIGNSTISTTTINNGIAQLSYTIPVYAIGTYNLTAIAKTGNNTITNSTTLKVVG